MTSQNAELITQLNTLLNLTTHEAATARIRISQATSDATRKELRENAANCDDRAKAIRQAVVDLGGVPDVVGAALNRAAAVAKAPLEQSQPITEALLADLALEHQLFDRARLVKVLAHDIDASDLVALAERLEKAHGETIQWLFTVLAETAVGGPAALAPTPTQTAAMGARTAATFAGIATVSGVNRAVATAGQLTQRVQDTTQRVQDSTSSAVTGRVQRVLDLARSGAKIVGAGRDASLAETEKQAGKEFGRSASSSVHKVRENLGVVDSDDLPVKRFDALTARDAATAVSKLRSVDDVQVVLAYEQAHKSRQSVVEAATKQVSALAKEFVNS